MELRNIHFSPSSNETPQAAVASVEPPVQDAKLRTRSVAVSPHEEFALRDGDVQPIDDSLAAMILSMNGRCEVSLKGVKIERTELGGVRHYWHADSILCNDLSQRERKLFYVVNRLDPSIAHILDETGKYLETL